MICHLDLKKGSSLLQYMENSFSPWTIAIALHWTRTSGRCTLMSDRNFLSLYSRSPSIRYSANAGPLKQDDHNLQQYFRIIYSQYITRKANKCEKNKNGMFAGEGGWTGLPHFFKKSKCSNWICRRSRDWNFLPVKYTHRTHAMFDIFLEISQHVSLRHPRFAELSTLKACKYVSYAGFWTRFVIWIRRIPIRGAVNIPDLVWRMRCCSHILLASFELWIAPCWKNTLC